ncbi:MAG: hypothetical protein GF311_27865 [Candidatus Lokiarchaeota archaeon]|nr:hypothetical protein [Candidatus Lokiarchaeota archaeon]
MKNLAQMPKRECHINEFITLRLEDGQTELYLNGEKFRQCKYLFIVNPEKSVGADVNSIDEAAEMFENTLEQVEGKENITPEQLGITPEEMFWGHCSNIQAWVEYGYDTRLLHSNLAFPLLKKIAELGDKTARRVFREEVVKRFIDGTDNTRKFLIQEYYIENLSEEELGVIVPPSEARAIAKIEQVSGKPMRITSFGANRKIHCYNVKDGHINGIYISNHETKYVPKAVLELPYLRYFSYFGKGLKAVPEWLSELKSLRMLELSSNGIERFTTLRLPTLEKLDLSYNNLTTIDFSGCVLPNLKFLKLYSNQLIEIKGLNTLKNLGALLIFNNNKLKHLPGGLFELENLGYIRVDDLIEESEEVKKLKKAIKKNFKKEYYKF